MGLLQCILIACTVNLGITSTLTHSQTFNQATIDKRNDGNKIQENLQNLFESITKNDARTKEVYLEILKHEVAKDRQASYAMKEEIQKARNRNSHKKRHSYDGDSVVVVKRETNENGTAVTSAKSLPTGSRLVPILRNNMTYVDKTGYILKLITSTDTFVFCARPPGFGKSLFMDTLQHILRGNESKAMFKGTEIYESDYSWPTRIVLCFDFDDFKHERDEFEKELEQQILDMEKVFFVRPILSGGFTNELANLILQIFSRTQEKVVVLVDNYDAPVVKCLPHNADIASRNFDTIRQFFACLKSLHGNIGLAFVTGVSRFPMGQADGLEMDNFIDVTLYENYTAAMGFTADEVKTHFGRFYKNVSVEEPSLRNRSFGYRFSSTNQALYHPHSVVQFFSPNDTVEFPKPAQHVLTAFEDRPHFVFTLKSINETGLIFPDIKKMTESAYIVPMLFQNGYLTIKNCTSHVTKGSSCYYYDLRFATSRFEDYFLNTILEEILVRRNTSIASDEFSEIRQYVMQYNLSSFLQTTNEHLQRVHYRGRDQRIYANLIECLLRVAGFSATWRQRLERASLHEIDCIFELLLDRNADDALQTMVSNDHKLSVTDGRFNGGVVLGLNLDTRDFRIDGCEAIWFDDKNNKTMYHYYHKFAWYKPKWVG